MAATIRNKLSGKRVRLNISGDADPQQINAILERVYGISGCDRCGRNGFDILITHGYPPLDGLKGLDVLQGAQVDELAAGR